MREKSLGDLLVEIEKRSKLVYETYILSSKYKSIFKPKDIMEGILLYPSYKGKGLRPAVLLFACGAVGGDENKALPAAAAVELFHTWTLVHDDIIDRDKKRRGGPTVHIYLSDKAKRVYGWDPETSLHYGLSLAILVGDTQKGWSIGELMYLLYKEKGVNPVLVLELIHKLDFITLNTLVEGESLDVLYSRKPVNKLTEKEIIDMLWRKTGALYSFCGEAGAMIGLNTIYENEFVKALRDFTASCGIAFQLQDDILGIVGDENKLGKPVGSDIREGKRTVILWYAYKSVGPSERKLLEKVVGNASAEPEEIQEVVDLLKESGAIDYAKNLAVDYVENSLPKLNILPETKYKDLLISWANFLIERKF